MDEFDRQLETLVTRGYPEAAGLTAAEFRRRLEPLRFQGGAVGEGRVPFVLVIGSGLVPWVDTIQRVTLGGRAGFSVMDPEDPKRFGPIQGVAPPPGEAWLIHDIDTGAEFLNVTPDDALVRLRAAGRTPLTIEEGIALVTHFPDRLKKNACFSLLGSRCTDRRVPALWISESKPKLGWCWAGNPHTWLGSASCGGRTGLPAEARMTAEAAPA